MMGESVDKNKSTSVKDVSATAENKNVDTNIRTVDTTTDTAEIVANDKRMTATTTTYSSIELTFMINMSWLLDRTHDVAFFPEEHYHEEQLKILHVEEIDRLTDNNVNELYL